MKKFLSLSVVLCMCLSFLSVIQAKTIKGVPTRPDYTFEVTNAKNKYYRILLKEDSLVSFKLDIIKPNDYTGVLLLNDAKGEGIDLDEPSNLTFQPRIFKKGTYYLEYVIFTDQKEHKLYKAKVRYNVVPVSQAKTIHFHKINKVKVGKESVILKTKVKGVQEIEANDLEPVLVHPFVNFNDMIEQMGPEYANRTVYFYIEGDEKAKPVTITFKAKRKILYKYFKPSFSNNKVHKIKLNKTYYDILTRNDVASYKFTLKKAKKIKIQSTVFKSKVRHFFYHISKENEKKLTIYEKKAKSFQLDAGTYYLNTQAYQDDYSYEHMHFDFRIKG